MFSTSNKSAFNFESAPSINLTPKVSYISISAILPYFFQIVLGNSHTICTICHNLHTQSAGESRRANYERYIHDSKSASALRESQIWKFSLFLFLSFPFYIIILYRNLPLSTKLCYVREFYVYSNSLTAMAKISQIFLRRRSYFNMYFLSDFLSSMLRGIT